MVFINELIPDADKPCIGEIVSPMTSQPISFYKWTIDRDKNAYLIKTGQDRDNPDDVYFLLYLNRERYKIRMKENITLHTGGGESYVYSLAYLAGGGEVVPSNDVKETLKEALSVFAGTYGTVKPIAVDFEF